MGSSIFAGAGESTGVKRGNYIRQGHFLMRIDLCKIGENRKKEPNALVEGTVITHLDSESENRVGENVTWLVKKASDYFLDEMVTFLGAATGMDIQSVSGEEKEEALAMIFDGDNPLSGTVMEVFAKDVITKSGNPFTQVTWRGEVEPQKLKEVLSEDEIAKFYPGDALDKIIAETA